MIAGDPQVIEREGEWVLVDANGDRVVIRRRTPHRQCTFHQVNLEAFGSGEIRPACNVHGQRESGTWDLARRGDLDAIWTECERPGCWCSASSEDGSSESREYTTLAGQLRSMSPDEYDPDCLDFSQFEPGARGEGE